VRPLQARKYLNLESLEAIGRFGHVPSLLTCAWERRPKVPELARSTTRPGRSGIRRELAVALAYDKRPDLPHNSHSLLGQGRLSRVESSINAERASAQRSIAEIGDRTALYWHLHRAALIKPARCES
jgi:hypothetical protein